MASERLIKGSHAELQWKVSALSEWCEVRLHLPCCAACCALAVRLPPPVDFSSLQLPLSTGLLLLTSPPRPADHLAARRTLITRAVAAGRPTGVMQAWPAR